MNKKAIIFGVTGQDGSHLADLLIIKGYTVIGVSRYSSIPKEENIQHLSKVQNFVRVNGDITDTFSIQSILKQHMDACEIYNLAAQSHVSVSFTQPAMTWDITGKGCLNILQSMVDLKMNARFYQASSSEMFGAAYSTDGTGRKFQNEDTKFMPQSPYAIAKCAAHYITRLFREAYGVHASAGILFNHEGPRRGPDFVTRKITKWIGEFIRWQEGCEFGSPSIVLPGDENFVRVHGKPLNKPDFPKLRLGNLMTYRDWGHASDYVRAMWMMLQQDKPDDYVICTGETHSIKDFLTCAFSSARLGDWSDYVAIDPKFYRPAEVEYLRGDASKANEKLGWRPECSFEEMVNLMVSSDINADL